MSLLNLGAGQHMAPKPWVNVDTIIRADGLNLMANVLNLPFRRKSCERIYAGHLVEHMLPEEASAALCHWLDLLAPRGELGVLVPDLQRMWKIYRAGGFTVEAMDGAVGGERDPLDPYAGHLTVWTIHQLHWFVSKEIERRRVEVDYMRLEDWPLVSTDDWQVGITVKAS